MLQKVVANRPASASTSTPLRHYDFVDALRGIAFLLVLLIHTSQFVPGLPDFAIQIASYGRFGVQLFFLLSAFTLFTSLAQRSPREARPIGNFFIRRFFRIAPLFWCAIVYYLAVRGRQPGAFWSQSGISNRDITLTALFLHAWTPTSINSVVPGGWTIGVEMSFYILIPWLFSWVTAFRRALWFFLATLGIRLIANLWIAPGLLATQPISAELKGGFINYWLPEQLPVFALGIVLYFIFESFRGDEKIDRADWAIFLLLAAATAVGLWQLFASPGLTWGLAFLGLSLSLALHPAPILVNRITRYVGEVSYSAYLVHFALLSLCGSLLKGSPMPPLVNYVVMFIVTGAATLATATLTFRLIEKPGRALGRRLIGA